MGKNILLFMTDQQLTRCTACAGDRQLQQEVIA